jgi:uncharacterized membrane protein YoaK (UPF0700 family)
MKSVQSLKSIAVPRPIPVLLSFVAGYVDSCTYLGLFGVFVAQVTGSFVLAGALFVKSEPGALAKLLAIPFFFFAGMAITVLVHSMRGRPRVTLAWSLGIESLLLVGFMVLSWTGAPFGDPNAPGAIAALLFGMTAMGVQSALVRLHNEQPGASAKDRDCATIMGQPTRPAPCEAKYNASPPPKKP